MTAYCTKCCKIERVCAIKDTAPRREAVYTNALLDCGHSQHFVTTELQLQAFRATKRLVSER